MKQTHTRCLCKPLQKVTALITINYRIGHHKKPPEHASKNEMYITKVVLKWSKEKRTVKKNCDCAENLRKTSMNVVENLSEDKRTCVGDSP